MLNLHFWTKEFISYVYFRFGPHYKPTVDLVQVFSFLEKALWSAEKYDKISI